MVYPWAHMETFIDIKYYKDCQNSFIVGDNFGNTELLQNICYMNSQDVYINNLCDKVYYFHKVLPANICRAMIMSKKCPLVS